MSSIIKKYTTQFLMVLLAVVVGYEVVRGLQSYADDPISIARLADRQPITVRTGGTFTFWRRICSTENVIADVHREFQSLETGDKYTLPVIQYVALAKNGCYNGRYQVPIPYKLPAGTYEYRPVIVYRVNSNLTIIKPAPGETIEVIE